MKFRLSEKYVIEFKVNAMNSNLGSVECEWFPRMPSKKRFQKLYPAYFKARQVFIAKMSEGMEGPVICMETTPEHAATLEAEIVGVKH